MCGIFGILNYTDKITKLEKSFEKGKNRGPEFSILKIIIIYI